MPDHVGHTEPQHGIAGMTNAPVAHLGIEQLDRLAEVHDGRPVLRQRQAVQVAQPLRQLGEIPRIVRDRPEIIAARRFDRPLLHQVEISGLTLDHHDQSLLCPALVRGMPARIDRRARQPGLREQQDVAFRVGRAVKGRRVESDERSRWLDGEDLRCGLADESE